MEQGLLLKSVTRSTKLRGNIDSASAVKKDLLSGSDSAFVGVNQSGDAIEDRSLAGSRRTKQDRDSRRQGNGKIKFEIPSRALANPDGNFFSIRDCGTYGIGYA